jgi:flavodoxin
MKIGIIVYSHTGNTLSVAEEISKACAQRGHTCSIERVTAENAEPGSKGPVRLSAAPDLTEYDAVIFGAPVYAFSLCPVMKLYLQQLPSLNGKKACCYVTQQLPKAWLGGNRAIRQMQALCKEKGAKAGCTGIVNWSGKFKDKQITDVAEAMSGI